MFGGSHNNWGPRPPASNTYFSSSPGLISGSRSSSSSVVTGPIATPIPVQVQPQLNLYQYPITNSNNPNHPIQHNHQSDLMHSTNPVSYPAYQATGATQVKERGEQATHHVQPRPTHVSENQQPVSINQAGVSVSTGVMSTGLPPWTCQLHLLPPVYRYVVSYATLQTGQLDTSKLYPVLMSSQLSKAVLGHLWSLVNRQTVGVLSVPECVSLLALIALAQINRLPQPLSDISILQHLHVGSPNFPVPVLSLPPQIDTPSSQTSPPELVVHQQKGAPLSRDPASRFGGQAVDATSKVATTGYDSPKSHLPTQHVGRQRQPYYPENVATRYDQSTFASERSQYCGGCEACCAAEVIQSELEEEEGGTLYIAEDLLYSGGSDSAESFQSSSSSSPSHGAYTDSPKMNWNIPSNRPCSTANPANARNALPIGFPSTAAEKPQISTQQAEMEDEFSGFESAVSSNFGVASTMTPANNTVSFETQSKFDDFRFNLGQNSSNEPLPKPKTGIEPSVFEKSNSRPCSVVIPQQVSDFGARQFLGSNSNADSSKQPIITTSISFESTLQANFADFSNATPQVEVKSDDQDDDFADFQDFKSSEPDNFPDWSTDDKKADFVSSVFSFHGAENNSIIENTKNESTAVAKTATVIAPTTSSKPVADKYAAFRDLELELASLDIQPPEDPKKSPSQDSQSTLTSLQSPQSVMSSNTMASIDVITSSFNPIPINPQTVGTVSSSNVICSDEKQDDFTDFQFNHSALQSAQKPGLPLFMNKISTDDFEPFADFQNVSTSNNEGDWANFSEPAVFPVASTDANQGADSSFSGKILGGSKLLKDMVPVVSSGNVFDQKGGNENDWAQFSCHPGVPAAHNAQADPNTSFFDVTESLHDRSGVNLSEMTSQSETAIITSQNESMSMTSPNETDTTVMSQNETMSVPTSTTAQIVTSKSESVSNMTSQNEEEVVNSCEDEWADFEDANVEAEVEEDEKGQQQVPDVSSLVWAKTQVSTDGFYDRIKQTILSEEVKKKPIIPSKILDKQLATGYSGDMVLQEKTIVEAKMEKPTTIFLTERYIGLDGASKSTNKSSEVTSDDSKQKEVWQKLLEQCREILSLALGALSPALDSEKVKAELRGSCEWVNFCCAAVLVYGVALRVMSSYRAANMNDVSVNDLIKSVDICWSELKPFFPSEIIQSETFELETKSQNVPAVAKFGAEACGVCLLRVDQSELSNSTSQSLQTLPSTNHRNSCISYGGRQYHAPCANLWVNKVDLVLPALLVIDVL